MKNLECSIFETARNGRDNALEVNTQRENKIEKIKIGTDWNGADLREFQEKTSKCRFI
jgi:hypothetical protein